MIPNNKENCKNFAHILVHNYMTIRQLRRLAERVLRKQYIDDAAAFNTAVDKFNATADRPFLAQNKIKSQESRQ